MISAYTPTRARDVTRRGNPFPEKGRIRAQERLSAPGFKEADARGRSEAGADDQ